MPGNNFEVLDSPTFGRLYNTSRDVCLGRMRRRRQQKSVILPTKSISQWVQHLKLIRLVSGIFSLHFPGPTKPQLKISLTLRRTQAVVIPRMI
jgi:hypothetical protein